jgi:hypothetical protein
MTNASYGEKYNSHKSERKGWQIAIDNDWSIIMA